METQTTLIEEPKDKNVGKSASRSEINGRFESYIKSLGNLREKSRPEILPFRGSNGKDNKIIYANKSEREIGRIYDPKGISPTLHLKTGGWQEPKIISLAGDRKEPSLTIKDESGTLPSNPMSDRQPFVVMNTLTEALGTRAGKSKEFISSVEKINASIGKIRRLTPLESERLQSFPDGWTEGISDTQRYKCLGNAVTTNVIEAIISKMITKIYR